MSDPQLFAVGDDVLDVNGELGRVTFVWRDGDEWWCVVEVGASRRVAPQTAFTRRSERPCSRP